MAKTLFVSGVYQGLDVKTLFRMFKRNPRGLESRIGIGTATNTLGNAMETADWFRGKGFKIHAACYGGLSYAAQPYGIQTRNA